MGQHESDGSSTNGAPPRGQLGCFHLVLGWAAGCVFGPVLLFHGIGRAALVTWAVLAFFALIGLWFAIIRVDYFVTMRALYDEAGVRRLPVNASFGVEFRTWVLPWILRWFLYAAVCFAAGWILLWSIVQVLG